MLGRGPGGLAIDEKDLEIPEHGFDLASIDSSGDWAPLGCAPAGFGRPAGQLQQEELRLPVTMRHREP